MKKRHLTLFHLFLMAFLVIAMAVPCKNVDAVSKKNKVAHTAYTKKIKKIVSSEKWFKYLSYKFYDLTGDGLDELVVLRGDGRNFEIYTYKSKKVVRIHSSSFYGFSKMTYYKKTKSIVIQALGHGDEGYRYLKLKGGKYKELANKYREGIKGGSMKNGPWYYYNPKAKRISSSSFNKLTKGMKKGKKVNIGYSTLKSYGF